MKFTPEFHEAVREAVQGIITRRLTPAEIFNEVVRVCREATTEEEVFAAGKLIGEVNALGRLLTEMRHPPAKPGAAPEVKDEPEQTGPFGEVAWGQADPVTDPTEPVS